MTDTTIVFLIRCEDQKGLIAKISSFFFGLHYNILSCQQFTDEIQNEYFMRIKLDGPDVPLTRKELSQQFAELAEGLRLTWSVHYAADMANTAIMVSKTSHCLFDLLERQSQREDQDEYPVDSLQPSRSGVSGRPVSGAVLLSSDPGWKQSGAGSSGTDVASGIILMW